MDAIAALEQALQNGLDPEAAPPRSSFKVQAGELLLMPAEIAGWAGVKVVGIAPANAVRGLPRIHGSYLLFDGETLAPVAVFDGAELTTLRTPAVSAVAVKRLARPGARHLVVFGAGPQSAGHVEAMQAILPTIERVDVIRRGDDPAPVAGADVICCCTTAREPLFDGALVKAGAVVVAVGSHEPDARELDSALMQRATVVVEARATALREAGDVIQAGLEARDLINLAELVNATADIPGDRPRVFKSTGMAWEDLVVAAALHRVSQR